MSAILTEEEFLKHVNTKFRALIENPVELELSQVKSYLPKEHEQSGMQRFSLYFAGPPEPYLPQQVYPIEHERMGAFELFLVPIGRDERGFQYEAVFNYFRQTSVE